MSFQAQAGAASFSAKMRCVAAFVLASGAIATLGACSGDGNGGTDVTIGSGQSGDAVTLDFPIFYVKRPVPASDAEVVTDARELRRFEPGADLYMRASASPSSPEINLTSSVTGDGRADIRDVEVSFDGKRVVFSMRVAEEGMDLDEVDAEEPLPSWNIWEYNVETSTLRRVIASDNIENDGHDIMPHYLPGIDYRIVFSSTRQREAKAILLDENKPQYSAQVEGTTDNRPAFNLHVMNEDGSGIRQLSFNQSHDLDPAVLANGQIVFTRWEQAIAGSQMDLYRINPDGTGLELLYGAHSHAIGSPNPITGAPTTIQFLNPRPMQDGRTLVLVRPFDGTAEGGDLVLIDTSNFVDCNHTVPTTTITPASPQSCNAQSRALPTDVRTVPGPSPGGRFRSASALFDGSNRLLVSWSQCRLIENGRVVPCTSERLNRYNPNDTTLVEAPALYGIYIYDVRNNTQRPIVAPEEGFIYTEVVAAAARNTPPQVLLDRIAGVDYPQELRDEAVGVLHIRSVYDIDGVDRAPGGIVAARNPAAPRIPRFLRLEKVVSQPDEDIREIANTAFGRGGRRFGMRDILGYAPIEPDGSVLVKVPANVPFVISVLDGNGRRVAGELGQLHSNWLQVQIGETLQCNGCHSTTVNAANPARPHGRAGLTTAINTGATTTSTYPNTNPALAPLVGETMAQTRGRLMCGGACEPTLNLILNDVWLPTPPDRIEACYAGGATDVAIDPSRPPAVDPSDITRRHVCGSSPDPTTLRTTLPTTVECARDWNGKCRSTIHYPTHIHPLWSVDRRVLDPNLDPSDPNAVMADNTCTSCHSTLDAANATRVPAGQLDLSDGLSDDEPDHLRTYRELLFADNAQELVGTQLQDICVNEVTNPDGTVVCVAFQQAPVTMSFNGANASRFFQKFDAGNPNGNHAGWLNPAELKLISEWLDIGAQYYNNPFAAPED
jgi:hypothetical protein